MPTMLYIDDTKADVELMRALLSSRDIEIDAAYTGAKGINTYDPARHCSVVIDWNLNDMQGLEVARALLARNPECPIAIISGLMEKEQIEAAAQLGIQRCFEKNMSLEHIRYVGEFVNESMTLMLQNGS